MQLWFFSSRCRARSNIRGMQGGQARRIPLPSPRLPSGQPSTPFSSHTTLSLLQAQCSAPTNSHACNNFRLMSQDESRGFTPIMSSQISDQAEVNCAAEDQPLESEMQQSSLAALDLRTETSLPSREREAFKHEPLPIDERFIRLITIEPTLSQSEGLIQCSMSHTRLLGAHYTCLSYR